LGFARTYRTTGEAQSCWQKTAEIPLMRLPSARALTEEADSSEFDEGEVEP